MKVEGASLVEEREKEGASTGTVSSYSIGDYPENYWKVDKWYVLRKDETN